MIAPALRILSPEDQTVLIIILAIPLVLFFGTWFFIWLKRKLK